MHVENNYAKQKLMSYLTQKWSSISYIKHEKHVKDHDNYLSFPVNSTENQRGRP